MDQMYLNNIRSFNITKNDFIAYVIVLLIVSIPCFLFIQGNPIQLWDESRLSMNAWEMYQNKNWLVTHFANGVEMWNTKPPLLIWLQTACLHIFGISIFSIRLPIALAGMATGLLLFTTIKKLTHNNVYAIFCVLVLFSSNGYVSNHVLRTGGYDGLLVLFLLSASIFYFQFLETKKYKYLYIFALSMCLALMTKGIAGLMFAPSLMIYTLYKKSLVKLLKTSHFYITILIILIPLLTYYLLRESVNPGYIKQVYINEIGGRYLQVVEGHSQPFGFYFLKLITDRFLIWIPTFVIGLYILIKEKKCAYFNISIFSLFVVFPFLLLISFSKTKLKWYDAPVFPFLAIIAAIPLSSLYILYSKNKKKA